MDKLRIAVRGLIATVYGNLDDDGNYFFNDAC
jgi:hypothetical protein